MVKAELASGRMPDTDLGYEQLEGLLASYYLTYQHLKVDNSHEFERLSKVLSSFSGRYSLQPPDEAIANVRAKKIKDRPHRFISYSSARNHLHLLGRDFKMMKKLEDIQDMNRLVELICSRSFVF